MRFFLIVYFVNNFRVSCTLLRNRATLTSSMRKKFCLKRLCQRKYCTEVIVVLISFQ